MHFQPRVMFVENWSNWSSGVNTMRYLYSFWVLFVLYWVKLYQQKAILYGTVLPMIAAVCPLSVQDTDGGEGTSAQTDKVPSVELQANRYLSSWANLIAVTASRKQQRISHRLYTNIKWTLLQDMTGKSAVNRTSCTSTQRQFLEKIGSEDDLRSRIFRTCVVKFLACLPLLGFSNLPKMV